MTSFIQRDASISCSRSHHFTFTIVSSKRIFAYIQALLQHFTNGRLYLNSFSIPHSILNGASAVDSIFGRSIYRIESILGFQVFIHYSSDWFLTKLLSYLFVEKNHQNDFAKIFAAGRFKWMCIVQQACRLHLRTLWWYLLLVRLPIERLAWTSTLLFPDSVSTGQYLGEIRLSRSSTRTEGQEGVEGMKNKFHDDCSKSNMESHVRTERVLSQFCYRQFWELHRS